MRGEEGGEAGFSAALDARTSETLERCTRCGACFDACPMLAPAGLDGERGPEVVGGILDLIRGEAAADPAVRWAEACSGSGACNRRFPGSQFPRARGERLVVSAQAPGDKERGDVFFGGEPCCGTPCFADEGAGLA